MLCGELHIGEPYVNIGAICLSKTDNATFVDTQPVVNSAFFKGRVALFAFDTLSQIAFENLPSELITIPIYMYVHNLRYHCSFGTIVNF